MKILEFITEEECEKLKELSQKEKLLSDNLNRYYHAENFKDDEDVKYINNLLHKTIDGFVSFSNFRKDTPNVIRIQYQWSTFFHGIGYVSIDELKDGFHDCKKEESA